MELEEILLRKLEEIREFVWTSDDALKIWSHYIKEGEDLLPAIARNLAEAIEEAKDG